MGESRWSPSDDSIEKALLVLEDGGGDPILLSYLLFMTARRRGWFTLEFRDKMGGADSNTVFPDEKIWGF